MRKPEEKRRIGRRSDRWENILNTSQSSTTRMWICFIWFQLETSGRFMKAVMNLRLSETGGEYIYQQLLAPEEIFSYLESVN
jgi:hypothetical protein